MKIYITENGGKDILLRVPTALIINRLAATLIQLGVIRIGYRIDKRIIHGMFMVLIENKRNWPSLNFLEVESAHGDSVKISL